MYSASTLLYVYIAGEPGSPEPQPQVQQVKPAGCERPWLVLELFDGRFRKRVFVPGFPMYTE